MAEPISTTISAITAATATTAAASAPVLTGVTAAQFAAAVAGTSALVVPTATSTILGALGSAASVLAPIATLTGALTSLAGAGMRVAGAQQNLISSTQQAQGFAYQAETERMRQQQALLQAQQGNLQADQALLQGRSAELAGQTEAARTRMALIRTLAAQNARYAGAGLALDEGTPGSVAEDSALQAEIELGLIDTNTQVQVIDRQMAAADRKAWAADRKMQAGIFGLNAEEYDRRGRETLRAGSAAFGVSIFDAADRLWQRMPGWNSSAGGGSTNKSWSLANASGPSTPERVDTINSEARRALRITATLAEIPGATAERVAELRGQLGQEGPGAAENRQVLEQLERAASERQRAIQRDPAAYAVAQRPELQRLQQRALETNDPAALGNFAAALALAQAELGVPPGQRQQLPRPL